MKDRTLAGQPDAAPPTEVPFSLWATGAGFGLYLAWGMLGASPSVLSPDVAAAVSFTAIGSLAERAVWLGFLVLYAAWAGIRRAAPYRRTPFALAAGACTALGTALVVG